MLRRVVTQHVDEVVDEAFGLLDTLTAAYEDIVSQLGEHELHTSDVQQQLVMKQEVPPEQQDWSSSLDQDDPEPPNIKEEQEDQENPEPPHIKEEQEDQEDPEPPHIKEEQEDPEPPHIKEEQEDPEPPHIKEEQDELRISQEGEQLQKLEEAGIKFSSTPLSPGEMLRRVVAQHVDEVVDEAFGLLDTLTAAYEDIVSQLGEHELHTSDVQQQLVMKQEVPPEQQDWSSSLDQEDPEPPNIKEEQEDQENPEPPHIKEEQEDQENPEPPHIKEEQEDQENPEPPHIKEEQEEQEDQEDPEPPHIKEEQDELRISQEGEQLQKLEEAGIKFSFTPVKSQYDDEEAQLSKSIKTDKRGRTFENRSRRRGSQIQIRSRESFTTNC
ncbi:glutamic acid-rich protein-like [Pseudoliparis swirei]|uniref:glutamic acid-rich protein-like n=1 Tax=Pseudoliparis swirei TaxID=2059687 RepID=UPI0024BD5CE0|nr:glutamic acid-rich protein-like [Pseudoliparis swirei]